MFVINIFFLRSKMMRSKNLFTTSLKRKDKVLKLLNIFLRWTVTQLSSLSALAILTNRQSGLLLLNNMKKEKLLKIQYTEVNPQSSNRSATSLAITTFGYSSLSFWPSTLPLRTKVDSWVKTRSYYQSNLAGVSAARMKLTSTSILTQSEELVRCLALQSPAIWYSMVAVTLFSSLASCS